MTLLHFASNLESMRTFGFVYVGSRTLRMSLEVAELNVGNFGKVFDPTSFLPHSFG